MARYVRYKEVVVRTLDLSFERRIAILKLGSRRVLPQDTLTCGKTTIREHQTERPYSVHFDVDQFKITWWSERDFKSARTEIEDLGLSAIERHSLSL